MRVLCLQISLGVLVFVIDMGLSISMALLLIELGIISPSLPILEQLTVQLNFSMKAWLIFTFVSLKGFSEWGDSVANRWGMERFRNGFRPRLMSWLLGSRFCEPSVFFGRYFQETEVATAAVGNAQVLVRTLTRMLLFLAACLFLAPFNTLVVLVAMALLALPITLIAKKSAGIAERQLSTAKRQMNRTLLNVRNLLLLRIHGMNGVEDQQNRETADELAKCGIHQGAIDGVTTIYCYVVAAAGFILIPIAERSGYFQNVSAIYLFLLYRFFSDSVGAFRIWPVFQFRWRTFRGLKQWWESELVAPRAIKTAFATELPFNVPFGWRVRDLTFAYTKDGRNILKDFDLDIAPGESLAICGPSGTGKTTLLHLLLGELSPQAGKVELVAGTGVLDVAAVDEELLPRVAYAGAESFLIPGSLRENLLYGLKREVSETELQTALEAAACGFVLDLPRGLDHTINEYSEGLSMGQKQRLCLARALLRRPQALFLDEVTAHLDEATEALIAEALTALRGKVTVICVTHRSGLIPTMQKKIYLGAPKPSPETSASNSCSRL